LPDKKEKSMQTWKLVLCIACTLVATVLLGKALGAILAVLFKLAVIVLILGLIALAFNSLMKRANLKI
jgi:F0F1-type ATP synthase assembly protein I